MFLSRLTDNGVSGLSKIKAGVEDDDKFPTVARVETEMVANWVSQQRDWEKDYAMDVEFMNEERWKMEKVELREKRLRARLSEELGAGS